MKIARLYVLALQWGAGSPQGGEAKMVQRQSGIVMNVKFRGYLVHGVGARRPDELWKSGERRAESWF